MLRPTAATIALSAAGVLALLVLTFPLGVFQALDAPTDAALAWTGDQPVAIGAGLVLDFMGGIEFVLLALAALVGILLWERRLFEAGMVVAAFGVAEVVTDGLKVLFQRARPLDGLLDTTSASFPSGHAMRGALLAILFGAYLWTRLERRPHARKIAVGAVAAWGVGMVVARLTLHVHWLSDVVAGATIGIGFGAAALAATTWMHTTGVAIGVPIAVTQRESIAQESMSQPPPQDSRKPR